MYKFLRNMGLLIGAALLVSLSSPSLLYGDEIPLSALLGKEFQGYKFFAHPTHVLRPGLIYISNKKTTITMWDLSREPDMITRADVGAVSGTSTQKSARSFIAVLLESVGLDSKTATAAAHGASLHFESVFVEELSEAEFFKALKEKDVARYLQNLGMTDLYVIVATVSVRGIQLDFPSQSAAMVKTRARPESIGSQFYWKSEHVLSLNYEGGLTVGFKAARLPPPGSLSGLSSETMPLRSFLPTEFQFKSPQGFPKKLLEANDFPDPTAIAQEKTELPTHQGPSSIGNPGKQTYGELLDQIEGVLRHSGMEETRVIPLGTGFGLVTALEVLEDNGTMPLAGPSRFFIGADYKERRQRRGEGTLNLEIKNFVERRRVYIIAVDGGVLPHIRSDDPEMLFRMDYGNIDLPNRTKTMRVDPGTLVRVFIYEFSKHNNEQSKLLSYGDCGQKLEDHLLQDKIWSK